MKKRVPYRVEALSDERVQLIEEGHRYVVGRGIEERDAPSFSAIMKSAGLATDYGAVDPTHLNFRAAVGTVVHALVENFLHDDAMSESPFDESQCDPLLLRAAEPHYDAFVRWVRQHELITHFSEVPAYHPVHKYCTTDDWIGILDGQPWVLDYKSTHKIARNVGYQTMAQRMCFRFWDEEGDECSPYRGALHLPKRGDAQVVEFTDDQFDRETVEAAVQCWKAKQAA